MPAGRPRKFRREELKLFADTFYSEFRSIAEGYERQHFNRKRFDEMVRDINNTEVQLSSDELLHIERTIDEDIRAGRMPLADKESRRQSLGEGLQWIKRQYMYNDAGEVSTQKLNVPGEPEVIDALLDARTPEDVREICKDAFTVIRAEVRSGDFQDVRVPNWPISGGSMLPEYLSQHADQFIQAKNDPRFPRSTDRPTTKLKQLWFLSRALAGALFGITTRTAINLLGSLRPEQVLEELNSGKPARKRRRS